MRLRKTLLCISFFLTLSHGAMAQEQAPETSLTQLKSESAPASNAIPFKSDPKSLAEQSLSTFFITMALLGVTVAGLYYLRRHLQKKGAPAFLKPASVRLKERVRISPQLTMYVLTYRDKEILIAHTGNSATAISESVIHPE